MPGARLCCCAVGAAGAHFTPKLGPVARARGEAAAQQCRRVSGRVTERYFWVQAEMERKPARDRSIPMNRRKMMIGAASAVFLPALPASARRPTTAERNRATLDALFTLEAPLYPWKHIVIHHTAAEHASKKGIDRYHRKRFDDPLGTQYHFLIHNGKKGPSGLIELARWPTQARSVHLFKPEGAPDAITICLIGNFEERRVPRRMMNACAELAATLSARFDIDGERITTHRGVDGRLTQCPGKHFSLKRLRRKVADLRASAAPPVAPSEAPSASSPR